jgi:hypothetical protein
MAVDQYGLFVIPPEVMHLPAGQVITHEYDYIVPGHDTSTLALYGLHQGQIFTDPPTPLFIDFPTTWPITCGADVTRDFDVDLEDLIAVVLAWGTNDHDADVDSSSVVALPDLVEVLSSWGGCP